MTGVSRADSKMVKGFNKKSVRKFRLMPPQDGSEYRTLVEITPGIARDDEIIDVETVDDQPDASPLPTTPTNPQVGESAKYGIYYDDRAYDYTRHLKPIGVTPGAVYVDAKIRSAVETEEGILEKLNKATYTNINQLDLDPSVRETLDALDDDAFVVEEVTDDYFQHLDEDLSTEDDSLNLSDEFEVDFGCRDDADMHVDPYRQREGLSDAELEDVMQDLLSLEQSARAEARRGKKSAVSREERITAAAKELDMARRVIDLDPEEVVKSALRAERPRRQTLVMVSDSGESEDSPSMVSPLTVPIVHSRIIHDPPKSRPQSKPRIATESKPAIPKVPINKGAARSRDETAEERKARKSLAKTRSNRTTASQ